MDWSNGCEGENQLVKDTWDVLAMPVRKSILDMYWWRSDLAARLGAVVFGLSTTTTAAAVTSSFGVSRGSSTWDSVWGWYFWL